MLRLLCWCAPALALPCLDSSTDCLETLTQQAIEQSSEIEAINEQLALTAERQDYAQNRQWTHYLTLDPVRLVQNVLGGGEVQRDRIAIAALELEAADLLRRREAVAEEITRDVVERVLDYEQLGRRAELVRSQLESHRLRVAVAEAKYRTGQGDSQLLNNLECSGNPLDRLDKP